MVTNKKNLTAPENGDRINPENWMSVEKEGLFCQAGEFYIDPLRPVKTAVITHGHADHARPNNGKVITTKPTADIMKVRYGDNCAEEFITLKYGEIYKINHEVSVHLVPAGHILGSAQAVIEYQNQKIVISGDYKRSPDPTTEAFKPVHQPEVFITEATFAIPVFHHPPIEKEVQKLLNSLFTFPERNHLVGVYALGKCQRLILALRKLGYDKPIYLHGALQKLCDLYQKYGFEFGELILVTKDNKKNLKGEIILCPPSALADRWSRTFGDYISAMASGWMQIRARAKQRRVELPLLISDHADWQQLQDTILEMQPRQVWVTHGQEDALVYWCKKQGIKAKALNLLGYEDDE